MDLAVIFLIWLAITVIDNLAKRKKRRIPPPQNQNDAPPDFDIPTIGGNPNFPGEEVPIFVEVPTPAEVRPKNPPRPKKPVTPARKSEELDALDMNLTPSTVLDAFVLTEILDKPKSLRRRRSL